MKIVYLHQYFNTPEMAGSTRSFEMAKRWVAAGHEVHVVTSSRNEKRDIGWSTTIAGGATIHWRAIPYDNEMGFVSRCVAFLKYAVLAGPRARSLRGDVVFATSTPLTIILPALLAVILRRTRIVFEVRDLWPAMPIAAGYLSNPILKLCAHALERVAYRSSRRIIALSDDMAAGIRGLGVPDSKIVVAPNSCDVAIFDIDESIGVHYREQADWLGARPFVAYCGTIGALNDVSYLVRVASYMRTRDPQVVFGIFGGGKDVEVVRTLAAKEHTLGVNVFLMGAISKHEVPAVLSAASVVTSVFLPIPEMRANSANKFFDGLAAAKPIAINYEGWQADILRTTGAGIVLDPIDARRAADQLAELLADQDRLGIASNAARRLAYEQFSRDRISEIVLGAILSSID